MLTTSQCVTLACLWEVMTPKPGNVHRGADFDDATLYDFSTSAVLIGPILAEAAMRGVGPVILDAVKTTNKFVGHNTNLGMILLLAPLAAVLRDQPLRSGVAQVLKSLTKDDAAAVYEAIAMAKPGGLGTAKEHDVAGPPPASLVDAMKLAENRDFIARQYVREYADIFEHVVPPIAEHCRAGRSLTAAVIDTFVSVLAQFGDSLIARKCGQRVSDHAAVLANHVIDAGAPGSDDYQEALSDLDFWLRSDDHRRNPGTTADLVAAGLFAVFRDGLVDPPWR
jgi:triphosphoribosyl-dephospho-CoA synthase